MKVRTAVIPVAGFGTRFLPVTRSVPKVMIPVLDTPAIHFVVEEAAKAGIENVVMVVSDQQEAINAYFQGNSALEKALEERGANEMLRYMRDISQMARISYVKQDKQLGLGHAVLTARFLVGDEPFAVFLPDDLIWHDTPTIARMIEMYNEFGGLILAVKEVPDESISSLGIIAPKAINDNTYEVVGVVEKPKLKDAPSNLAIIGRYVLSPEIFTTLEKTKPGAIGEIQLTDAIGALLKKHRGYAYRFPGTHFDIGTPLGLLKASVYAALLRETMAQSVRDWLVKQVPV